MSAVNVGLIGVGNCTSFLVQGVEYYSNTAGEPSWTDERRVGRLWRPVNWLPCGRNMTLPRVRPFEH